MFRSIFKTFANCIKIPELKSRILFTLGVLTVVRLIAWIRIPGLDGTALSNYFNSHSQSGGGMLGMYNTFAGGALEATEAVRRVSRRSNNRRDLRESDRVHCSSDL